MTTSHKKRRVSRCGGLSHKFDAIADNLRVSAATAEVYTIDMVFEGHATLKERQRLLRDMDVDDAKFEAIVGHLQQGVALLRQIKDATDFRYNEIRAVIAYLVHE